MSAVREAVATDAPLVSAGFPGAESGYMLSDTDFHRLRAIIHARAGFEVPDAKRQLVHNRVSRRLRALGLRTFAAYCARLEAGDAVELEQFTNAMTTNLTSFFREAHHFERLAGEILPELLERNAASQRIRVWSAGCSTGEEPYSIAMVLAEQVPRAAAWDVQVIASDLDSKVLDTARRGVYPLERVESMAPARRQHWLLRGKGERAGFVRVKDTLRRLVEFRQVNLIADEWPADGRFDCIFCRNVMIYFAKDTQRVLVQRFADALADHGHLVIGHSESLYRVSDRFRPIGQTVYRKVS